MANNNKFMDITKWKKIEARAKRASKYLDKVAIKIDNWIEDDEDEDDDYDDDVSFLDAWEQGTLWIDNWYDAVVQNGLYDLNGKKIHILYKSPKVGDDDGEHEILLGLGRFGFRTENFIQIDYNDSDWKAETIEWCVVAVVDGIKTLIIPHKRGDFNPKAKSWVAWNELANCLDNCVEEDDEMADDDSVARMESTNIEYLSWYQRDYDFENSGYYIHWSSMRRIA